MKDLLNFIIALCFHNPYLFEYDDDSWIFIQPLLGLLQIRNENLFVYIEHACDEVFFSFVQVKLYVTMGRAYLGQVQFSHRAFVAKSWKINDSQKN
jgi:hypothetical protein